MRDHQLHDALKLEADSYEPMPIIRKVDNIMIQRNYLQIKSEVREIVQAEIDRINNNPALHYLVIKKE